MGKRGVKVAILAAAWLTLVHAGLATAQPTSISACGSIGSGSYVLTQNFFAPPNGPCLTLTSGNITIDFNGFTITGSSGPGFLPPFPGITDGGSARSNIVIGNGTIRTFTGNGIDLGASSTIQIDRMRVISNGGNGILAGNDVSVTNSSASSNGASGISVGSGSTITGNSAHGNFGTGINVGDRSTILNNTANGNVEAGVNVACPSNLIGNTAQGNGSDLVKVGSGCKIVNNLF